MASWFVSICLLAVVPAERQTVLVVVGADGTPEYAQQFETWAGRWQAAADKAGAEHVAIGRSLDASVAGVAADGSDRELLRKSLVNFTAPADEVLWIVLIGHGTFDGRQAKFNLRGIDVTATELKEWLLPVTRPTVIINCSSCSGPFLQTLSAPNRVVVTSTRTGREINFSRFGDYVSSALTDPIADLDKDGQVSVLETFVTAATRTQEFYDLDSRIAMEHALIDDNGDQKGTPADWFQGVRVVKTSANNEAADGLRANQIALIRSEAENRMSPESRVRRDGIEAEIDALRRQKGTLAEDVYLLRLEVLLLDLARLYAATDQPLAPTTDEVAPQKPPSASR